MNLATMGYLKTHPHIQMLQHTFRRQATNFSVSSTDRSFVDRSTR